MTPNALVTELRRIIDRQPRFSVSLLPTPLMELPRFSAALGGPRILMKRDDLTGLAYGGNKARILDFFIGDALAKGCDVFIGGGGAVQSNHALMCAAAARKAGMKPVIFAQAETKYYELQGDYLLTKMVVDDGVYLYSNSQTGLAAERHKPQLRSTTAKAAITSAMQQVADDLRAKGHNPYVLPGSGQPIGAVGYVECALELAQQCETRGIEPNWIFLTSSGVGQAGLLLGTKFLQLPIAIVGSTPDPDRTEIERSTGIADLANRTAELLGLDLRLDAEDVINLDYGGEAYGLVTEAGLEAMRLLLHTEGLFLDPVYNSKGMSALIDQIRREKVGPNDIVIYIHTGGGPLNFAYSEELVQAYDLSLEDDRLL